MKISTPNKQGLINETQYLELCKACDQILQAQDSTPERMAISSLHIIREHPAFLPKYTAAFEPAQGLQLFFQLTTRSVRNYVAYLVRLGKALISHETDLCELTFQSRTCDFVFVSHLVNHAHIGQPNDFYYGDVPNELARHGHSVAIVLINHTGAPINDFPEVWRSSSVNRIILNKSLNFFAEVLLRRRAARESQRLTAMRNSLRPLRIRWIAANSAIEAVAGSTIANMRIASQISKVTELLRPKVMVVTHEGHAFERVIFASAREAMPEVCCVAYQHSALFRLQHSIRRNLSAPYNPDYILASGLVSEAQLKNAPGLANIPISVLGSTRTPKSTRASLLESKLNTFETPKLMRDCLVVPEYEWSECDKLFEFSLECALVLPHINFIWRLHPIISFKTLLKRNRRLNNRPPNVELSDKSLEEDITRCRWALYRGTTAVVQAVMGGLTPIYLQIRDEMTIDPLYEIEKGKFVVQTPAEFVGVVGKLSGTTDNTHHQERADLVDYCSKFYVPMDFRVLEKIIRDAPLRERISPDAD